MNECTLCTCSDDDGTRKEEKEIIVNGRHARTYTHTHTHIHTHTSGEIRTRNTRIRERERTNNTHALAKCRVSLRLTGDWPTGLPCLANQLVGTRAALTAHVH